MSCHGMSRTASGILGNGSLPPPPIGFAPSEPLLRTQVNSVLDSPGCPLKLTGPMRPNSQRPPKISPSPKPPSAPRRSFRYLSRLGSPRWRGAMSPSTIASSHTLSINWVLAPVCHQTHRGARRGTLASDSPVSVSFRFGGEHRTLGAWEQASRLVMIVIVVLCYSPI